MNLIYAIICGIIQGAAEFLPISSSGHLSIFNNIWSKASGASVQSYDAFELLLHLATLVAVCFVYWKDIIILIYSFFTMMKKVFHGKFKMKYYNPNERMVIMLIIAVLPLIVGVFLEKAVESVSAYTWAIGIILLFNAAMLYISDGLARGGVNKKNTTPKKALKVGCGQLLAVFPGLSRSGTTITVGLSQGFDRTYAVKFSFLLSIPAILGGCVLKLKSIGELFTESSLLVPSIIGMLVAFVCGFFAIKLLIYVSKHSNFRAFSYYCAVMGVICIILGIAGFNS